MLLIQIAVHARNHAAFWDGKILKLTPAYDICPQPRAGNEASQAMLISGNNNLNQFKYCLETAHNFQLSREQAISNLEEQKETITNNWDSVCKEAELSDIDRQLLWNRQFLNPFSIEY